MGGYSSEWEISMLSGQTVFENLNEDEWDIYKVIITKDSWTVQKNQQSWPLDRGNLTFTIDDETVKFDVIFNAIHGHPGEDGYLQALFELNNIPHSSCGFFESALTFNKNKTNALLNQFNVKTPNARFYTNTKDVNPAEIAATMGFPLFIKPNRSGSSFGVTKVKTEEEILPAIKAALKEDTQVLIEGAVVGLEVGCGVARQNGVTKAISITEIVPKHEFFDYEAKYKGESEEITPARITQTVFDFICSQSEKIYDYLGLWGIIRIDYIIENNMPILIEVNSIPGLSPASIIPQQLKFRNIELTTFFGDLLKESIAANIKIA